ncbi:MAG: hypothetical protein ABIP16_07035 [Thermomonas sp.]
MNLRPPHSPESHQMLDAEERALVKALPRLHGRTTPGPDLDASILAAAQAAVQPASRGKSPVRPRVSWIAPAALAASMVLAVGMALQLRPLPAFDSTPTAAQSDEADQLAVSMIESAPADMPVPMVESKPAPAQPVTPARQQGTFAAANPPEALPSADADAGQAPVSQSAPSVAPVMAAPPAPAPTPPSPSPSMSSEASSGAASSANILQTRANERAMGARKSAAGAAADIVSSDALVRDAAPAAGDKTSVTGNARPPATKTAQPVSAAPVSPTLRNEAEMAADSGFADDPEVDIPPATAASPAVRDAWLRRIGQLLEQGSRLEAKASLAEFRRRYPTAVLPPALQALEIEP